MSEGLSCCNSADLPLRAVDGWLALLPGCMDNHRLSESFKTCFKDIFTLEGFFKTFGRLSTSVRTELGWCCLNCRGVDGFICIGNSISKCLEGFSEQLLEDFILVTAYRKCVLWVWRKTGLPEILWGRYCAGGIQME